MEPLTWAASSTSIAVGFTLNATFMGITLDQWVVIGCGLAIGVVARFCYLLSLKKPVWLDLIIAIGIAPMNGVLAAELIETINLHNVRLLLATSLIASTSTMAFIEARIRFLRWRNIDQPTTQLFTTPDTVTHLPTNSRPVDITSVGENSPQTTGEVAVAELGKVEPITDNGESLAALLHKLDGEM